MIQILYRRTKNNPVLLGEAGVGKTAIVEGLAQEITAGKMPELLRDKRVITLDLALMLPGQKIVASSRLSPSNLCRFLGALAFYLSLINFGQMQGGRGDRAARRRLAGIRLILILLAIPALKTIL